MKTIHDKLPLEYPAREAFRIYAYRLGFVLLCALGLGLGGSIVASIVFVPIAMIGYGVGSVVFVGLWRTFSKSRKDRIRQQLKDRILRFLSNALILPNDKLDAEIGETAMNVKEKDSVGGLPNVRQFQRRM